MMLALIVTAVLSLLIVTVVTRASLESGLSEFLERQEARQLSNFVLMLAEVYRRNDGWTSLAGNESRWNSLLEVTRPEARPEGRPGDIRDGRSGRPGAAQRDFRPRRRCVPPPRQGENRPDPGDTPSPIRQRGDGRPPNHDRLRFRERLFLLDKDFERIVGAIPSELDVHMAAIDVDGETVGWLGFEPPSITLIPEAVIFLSQQRQSARLSLIAALILATVVAFFLARHLSRPVHQLADTVRRLSTGDYAARTDVSSKDEIGLLACDVNSLADTLDKAEQLRQRWMAEVAHELRTPIAILKGELEALGDGVRQPDVASLMSLRDEVDHLAGLVDDLQMLALSDSGALRFDMQPIDLSGLVRSEADVYRPRYAAREMALELRVDEGIAIDGDVMRLRQLLHNLLENSLRYTHAPGRVELGLSGDRHAAIIWLEDSEPGLSGSQLKRLFDRFYRADESRNRAAGGSGLGLAICRRIVEAHGGTISATDSRLGGVSMRISLPRNP